jgi:hypothetical protein
MVTTWQAILVGVALAYAPLVAILVFILRRDGAFSPFSPRRYKPEIVTSDRVPYSRLASEVRNAAEHVNDPLRNQHELSERLALIQSCRCVLVAVNFDVGAHPGAGRIVEDDDDNETPLAP